MNYRTQKNVTFTKEQEQAARELYGKVDMKCLAKRIGVKYGKTIKNLKVMGLHVTNDDLEKQRVYNFTKVINMEPYFDIDVFAKYYNY